MTADTLREVLATRRRRLDGASERNARLRLTLGAALAMLDGGATVEQVQVYLWTRYIRIAGRSVEVVATL